MSGSSEVDVYEKVWEKCARLLMLNAPTRLDDLRDTVAKVISNAVANPFDPKYRTLKISNSMVKSKIMEVSGGLDFMLAVGFELRTENENKMLVYSDDDAGLDGLETGLSWLVNTINTCKQFGSQQAGAGSDTAGCAQCVINIRLPTGSSVLGGFMRGDKLRDVRSYACCYFLRERESSVKLVLPEPRAEVEEEQLDRTLEDLGMCPRAVVIASIYSEQDRARLLSRKHVEAVVVNVTAPAEQIKKVKRDKELERKAQEDQRSKALQAFKDDRAGNNY